MNSYPLSQFITLYLSFLVVFSLLLSRSLLKHERSDNNEGLKSFYLPFVIFWRRKKVATITQQRRPLSVMLFYMNEVLRRRRRRDETCDVNAQVKTPV